MAISYPYPPGESTVKWVSTDWLSSHLDDKGLTIIDCQPNVHEYLQDHIPGARYASEGLFRVHGKTLPTEWVIPTVAEGILQTLGLDPNSPVVVYSGSGPLTTCGAFIGDGLEQTMVAYSLARFGHKKVCVLDGGFEKWRDEKRSLTRVFPPPAEASRMKVIVQDDFFIGYEDLQKQKDRHDTVLLDARPPAFYEGQGPWIKPGHIPGAINLPWKTLMAETNKKLLKPEPEIRKIISDIGITHEKTIITSCGTGREATNEFILFRYFLGFPKVKLYEGGFTEWSAYPDNPVVTGKNPG